MAFGTSHVALQERANLQPGQTVLVLGAAGGVGIAAVQVLCGPCSLQLLRTSLFKACNGQTKERSTVSNSYSALHLVAALCRDGAWVPWALLVRTLLPRAE